MKNVCVKDSARFTAAAQARQPSGSGLLKGLFGLLLLAVLIGLPVGAAMAAGIVLDPGHGGNDRGAGAGDEFNEKRFTLSLAQMVAAELSPTYRVELTRSADIELAPADRAGLANHLKADLMVSLHGGVAPYCSHRSAIVYYHDDKPMVLPPTTADRGAAAESGDKFRAWEKLQIRHRQKSRKVAETIRKSLAASDAFDSVAVYRAPLAPLMGADLPAVLLEVGCFNPATALSRSQFEQDLNDFAGPIAGAIVDAVQGLRK